MVTSNNNKTSTLKATHLERACKTPLIQNVTIDIERALLYRTYLNDTRLFQNLWAADGRVYHCGLARILIKPLMHGRWQNIVCCNAGCGRKCNTGWNFVTKGLCRTAIDMCFVFYVGDKVILYHFLNVHQASAYSARRSLTPCSRP